MTVKISQENGKAVVSVDGNEALKADAAGNVEVVGDLTVEGLVADDVNGLEVGLGGGDSNLNVAVGLSALDSNTTGVGNTGLGSGAGRFSVGFFNTFVGISSGRNIQSSRNTVLGSYTGNQNGLDITASNSNIAISDGGGKVSFFKDSSDNVHLRTGNENRLTVQPSGNVSIANDLEVNGTTIAALISRIEALEAGN